MTATWRQVARKDFEDAIRSKLLWGLTAVFVAFLVMALLSAEELFPEAITVDTPQALAGVAMLAQLFIPGVALVVGYMSVVGERQSGSLRVLLSYPFSRFDVVLGKLLGRTLVTAMGLAISYAVASAVVVLLYGTPDVETLIGFVAIGVLVGMSFTALAVGGSAAAATRGRARTLTIGSFMAMVFFWNPVVVGLHYVVTGSLPGLQADRWYFLLKRLNPLEAFRVLSEAVLGRRVDPVPRFPLEDVPVDASRDVLAIENRVVGEVPFYLQDWFSAIVLVAWGVVPVVIGYWYFERADLD